MKLGLAAVIECLHELRDWAHVVSRMYEHEVLELERLERFEPSLYEFNLGDGICDNIHRWMCTYRPRVEDEAWDAFEYLSGIVFEGHQFPVEGGITGFNRPGKWTGERGLQRRELIDQLIAEATSCLEVS